MASVSSHMWGDSFEFRRAALLPLFAPVCTRVSVDAARSTSYARRQCATAVHNRGLCVLIDTADNAPSSFQSQNNKSVQRGRPVGGVATMPRYVIEVECLKLAKRGA
eukprot:scaffold4372_cov397-Prasinococcus_capsulatus_cf.AAC.30